MYISQLLYSSNPHTTHLNFPPPIPNPPLPQHHPLPPHHHTPASTSSLSSTFPLVISIFYSPSFILPFLLSSTPSTHLQLIAHFFVLPLSPTHFAYSLPISLTLQSHPTPSLPLPSLPPANQSYITNGDTKSTYDTSAIVCPDATDATSTPHSYKAHQSQSRSY
nr:hypothetical transcript [Hymenolepis microstoma]